jgi:hypothetical protein
MDYLTARDQIRDGHLVFFKPAKPLAHMITFLTRGEVSHCGIAVWMTDGQGVKRLALIEGYEGGCRLVTMSYYSTRPMIVVDIGINWTLVEDYAYEKTGRTAYGYLDYATIWLKETLVRLDMKHLASHIPNTDGEVCSEVVADVVKHDPRFKIVSTLISPQKLLEYARTVKVAEIDIG